MQRTGRDRRCGECHPGTLANLVRPFTDLSVPNTPPSAPREAEHAAESRRLQGFQRG